MIWKGFSIRWNLILECVWFVRVDSVLIRMGFVREFRLLIVRKIILVIKFWWLERILWNLINCLFLWEDVMSARVIMWGICSRINIMLPLKVNTLRLRCFPLILSILGGVNIIESHLNVKSVIRDMYYHRTDRYVLLRKYSWIVKRLIMKVNIVLSVRINMFLLKDIVRRRGSSIVSYMNLEKIGSYAQYVKILINWLITIVFLDILRIVKYMINMRTVYNVLPSINTWVLKIMKSIAYPSLMNLTVSPLIRTQWMLIIDWNVWPVLLDFYYLLILIF